MCVCVCNYLSPRYSNYPIESHGSGERAQGSGKNIPNYLNHLDYNWNIFLNCVCGCAYDYSQKYLAVCECVLLGIFQRGRKIDSASIPCLQCSCVCVCL